MPKRCAPFCGKLSISMINLPRAGILSFFVFAVWSPVREEVLDKKDEISYNEHI